MTAPHPHKEGEGQGVGASGSAGPGHTPGLWEATERSGYHEIVAPSADCDWYGQRMRHAVAYIDTDIEEAEALANARLIAAAPELLAVLERAEGVLRDYIFASGEMDDDDRDLLATIRATIARARGEAQ